MLIRIYTSNSLLLPVLGRLSKANSFYLFDHSEHGVDFDLHARFELNTHLDVFSLRPLSSILDVLVVTKTTLSTLRSAPTSPCRSSRVRSVYCKHY